MTDALLSLGIEELGLNLSAANIADLELFCKKWAAGIRSITSRQLKMNRIQFDFILLILLQLYRFCGNF